MDTRASYDAVAATYAARFAGELEHKPLDRAFLTAFASQVGDRATVIDVGCGPGHVVAFLHALGLDARGLDLSPAMIDEARRLHPALRFDVGSMLQLPLEDASVAGITAFYSISHLDDDAVPHAFAEFHRALRPGGLLLLAVHVGDEVRHVDELLGAAVDLDFHFHRTEALAALLDRAGLRVDAVLERRAYVPHEVDTRRGYLLATRSDDREAQSSRS